MKTSTSLTTRQLSVCSLRAIGLRDVEISNRLGINLKSIRNAANIAKINMGALTNHQLMFMLGRELQLEPKEK